MATCRKGYQHTIREQTISTLSHPPSACFAVNPPARTSVSLLPSSGEHLETDHFAGLGLHQDSLVPGLLADRRPAGDRARR